MTNLEQVLVDALKKIREIGYNSQAARATDSVMACIRVAEAAILEAEPAVKKRRVPKRAAAGVAQLPLPDAPFKVLCELQIEVTNGGEVLEHARTLPYFDPIRPVTAESLLIDAVANSVEDAGVDFPGIHYAGMVWHKVDWFEDDRHFDKRHPEYKSS